MSKKQKASPTLAHLLKNAKFAYISKCCNEVAEKPPCEMEKGKGIGLYPGAKPEGATTLGSWRCSKCRKPCKVSRQPKSTVTPVQETHI